MGYKVINAFKDKEDNNRKYKLGDPYPKGDYQPTEERFEELSKNHPKENKTFIQAFESEEERVEREAKEEEEKKSVKEELESLGVSFHPNTGLEKLREKLKEAKAENEKE